jgi:hypothetical protein
MKRLAFSDDMMRALAAGVKTMTRRPMRSQPWPTDGLNGRAPLAFAPSRFRVGDLAAATCAYVPVIGFDDTGADHLSAFYRFSATGELAEMQFKTSRVMPAALAPFVLRITEVRAERLGEISYEDAIREGATRREWTGTGYHAVNGMCSGWSMCWSDLGKLSKFASGVREHGQKMPLTEQDICLGSPRSAFGNYWEKLYGAGSWNDDAQKWVWVLGFEVAERRI